MRQYIDKDALVAEIRNKVDSYRGDGIISIGVLKQHCEDFIYSLNSLDVKEVDLEKEFEKCCENYTFDDECEVYTARHFFELGIAANNKAQKGE